MIVYVAKSVSDGFYQGKKFTTSSLEILCFQRNHGYENNENVAVVFWGIKAYSESREVIENIPHAIYTCISHIDVNIGKLNETELKNHRVSIKDIADDLNISFG